MNKAIFIDRDGTIVEDKGYTTSIEPMTIIPKVTEALKKLENSGFIIIVITNQSGIGNGLFSWKDVVKYNNNLKNKLLDEGISKVYFYVCPHPKEILCTCRKPMPGLILQAIKDHNINYEESFMIGDKEIDIHAGRRAGCRDSFMVLTGRNPTPMLSPGFFNLNAVADYILKFKTK